MTTKTVNKKLDGKGQRVKLKQEVSLGKVKKGTVCAFE